MATAAGEALREAKRAYRRRELDLARARAEDGLRHRPEDPELLHLAGCVALDQQRLDDARDLLGKAHRCDPQSEAIAYNFGNTCFALQDYAASVSAFSPLLDWPPRAADVAFKTGYALGRVGEWQAAAAALLLAARRGDTRGETARGVGECARELAATGQHAPPHPLPPERAPGRISVVVCSIAPEKLARLRQNLDERLAGEDWELIHVDDATSLCDGYNRGVARASGELIVMCHDDIRVVSPDFAARLRAYLATYDLIGVAGTTHVSGPSWGWSGPPHTFCWVSQAFLTAQYRDAGPVTLLMGARGPVVPGAQMLDGVFLAARRNLAQTLGFDAVTFDRFHFYDLDFSYRAHLAGAKLAICLDIALFHDSAGNYDEDYWRYADRFRAKFPQACTAPEHARSAIPWMPLAKSDAALLEELGWLRHWVSRSDADLLAIVRSAASPRTQAGPHA
ncbi:MAG TPA: glycosyltransferase [Rudaea sp.]|nr:glycosyltransferase [Rudaea sp.]